MRKHLLALAAAVVAGGPAMAQPQATTQLEVLGNYAGRKLQLTLDGRSEWDGYGHLNPPGVSWILSIKPGDEPALLELSIEPCETPFKAELPRDGKTHALLIQGCEIKLLAG